MLLTITLVLEQYFSGLERDFERLVGSMNCLVCYAQRIMPLGIGITPGVFLDPGSCVILSCLDIRTRFFSGSVRTRFQGGLLCWMSEPVEPVVIFYATKPLQTRILCDG